MAEWLRSPPLDQQVDLEGPGSNPGADKQVDQQVDLEGLGSIPVAGKLDSGFQLSVK